LVAKQLGLSRALTRVGRCAHYGDTRVLPLCRDLGAAPADVEVTRLRGKLEEKSATVKRQSAAIANQSRAIGSLRAENERLRGAPDSGAAGGAGEAAAVQAGLMDRDEMRRILEEIARECSNPNARVSAIRTAGRLSASSGARRGQH
jgi:hypothetical protein